MLELTLLRYIATATRRLHARAPLPNPRQRSIPHWWSPSCWISREYLPIYKTCTEISKRTWKTISLLPIPPHQDFIDLLFFIRVLKQLQEWVVEPLRVCDRIHLRKHRWRHKRKANLESMFSESEMWYSNDEVDLRGNVHYWWGGDSSHPMNSCISRASGFRFLVHRTWRREHMFVSLCTVSDFARRCNLHTYRYEESAAEKTIPWVLWIIMVIGV